MCKIKGCFHPFTLKNEDRLLRRRKNSRSYYDMLGFVYVLIVFDATQGTLGFPKNLTLPHPLRGAIHILRTNIREPSRAREGSNFGYNCFSGESLGFASPEPFLSQVRKVELEKNFRIVFEYSRQSSAFPGNPSVLSSLDPLRPVLTFSGPHPP